jgi:hypothetical protein
VLDFRFVGRLLVTGSRLTKFRKKFGLTKTCFGLKEEFLEEPNFVTRASQGWRTGEANG